MRTMLYWFSGTGNSLAIARALARALAPAELVHAVQAMEMPSPPGAKRVGLVFPVLGFGPPLAINRLAERLEASPETYIFAVAAASGPGGAGDSHRHLRHILRRRGLELAAGFTVPMVGNCISLHPLPGAKQRAEALEASAGQVDRVAAAAIAMRRARLEDTRWPFRWIARAVYRRAVVAFPREDRRFRVTDACTSCGLCERICPVANIELRDGRPAWLGRCEQCYACIHWCPPAAIEVGHATVGRERYHHPDVRAADLFLRG